MVISADFSDFLTDNCDLVKEILDLDFDFDLEFSLSFLVFVCFVHIVVL
jgi:hypothetical protein